MHRQFKTIAVALTTLGMLGTTQIAQAVNTQGTPERSPSTATLIAANTHTYSGQFVELYTSNCAQRLTQHGKPTGVAKSTCQCSMKQMQLQHSQGEAISILLGAQLSLSKDARTGLPTQLSKYFTPCLAEVS